MPLLPLHMRKGRDCAAAQLRSIDIDFDQCTIRRVRSISLRPSPMPQRWTADEYRGRSARAGAPCSSRSRQGRRIANDRRSAHPRGL